MDIKARVRHFFPKNRRTLYTKITVLLSLYIICECANLNISRRLFFWIVKLIAQPNYKICCAFDLVPFDPSGTIPLGDYVSVGYVRDRWIDEIAFLRDSPYV